MDRLKTRIKANFKEVGSVAAINSAASLAYHGLLTSVKTLTMCNMDLSKVPTSHLNALASCPRNFWEHLAFLENCVAWHRLSAQDTKDGVKHA